LKLLDLHEDPLAKEYGIILYVNHKALERC
jgi:hypothetical protein